MCKIKLRALTETDIPKTLVWNNQDDIKDMYAGHPFPINLEMEKEWYDKITRSNIPITVFGIELVDEKRLIGLSFLKNINFIHRKAEFAIFIGDEKVRGKGYSKDATIQTLKFGFLELGLNRIFLNVLITNDKAIRLYENIGFVKEGVIRNSTFKRGIFLDEFVMGMLSTEFKVHEF
jgi:RimJ/RimL family protein N-acetyltransferase